MKKVYILEDLDCAHCAALIEEEVGKLEGVSKSSLAFLTQKLTIEVAEDKAATVEKAIIDIVNPCIFWYNLISVIMDMYCLLQLRISPWIKTPRFSQCRPSCRW